jgi:hypothetical protein
VLFRIAKYAATRFNIGGERGGAAARDGARPTASQWDP